MTSKPWLIKRIGKTFLKKKEKKKKQTKEIYAYLNVDGIHGRSPTIHVPSFPNMVFGNGWDRLKTHRRYIFWQK